MALISEQVPGQAGGFEDPPLRRGLNLEGLADKPERATAESRRESLESQKHLGRDERVAAGGMAIVRDDTEHRAQAVERELPDRWTAGERAVQFEVQRQIHRVETAVHQLDAPVPLERRVDRADVKADVMTDDHSVLEIVEKAFERDGLLNASNALLPGHAVDSHRLCIAIDFDQRVERILDEDLGIPYGDGAHRDQTVDARIESRRLRVEDDETHRIDGRVASPGVFEAGAVAGDEGGRHSRSIHPRSPVNSMSLRMARNPPLSS